MTAFEIYKKTFRFTLMRILSGLIGVVLMVGLPALAFAVTGKMENDAARIGVCVGAFIVACIVVGLLSHFIGYVFRAGQIAVAAGAIAEGTMPEDPYAAGKAAVKKRFGTVALFFAIEKIINGIVHQITNAVTKLTDKLGGSRGKSEGINTMQTIGAIINIIIAAMLKFMCACVMGWVFIHPDENGWRCAADGALIYFKNWKDLLKNTAKVIGIGLLSLIVIGGLLFGISHLVFDKMPVVNDMANELETTLREDWLETDNDGNVITDENGKPVPVIELSADTLKIIFEVLVALIVWGIINSALVDPYVMISVMNRYIKAGLANAPARDLDGKLAGMSKAYKKAISTAE